MRHYGPFMSHVSVLLVICVAPLVHSFWGTAVPASSFHLTGQRSHVRPWDRVCLAFPAKVGHKRIDLQMVRTDGSSSSGVAPIRGKPVVKSVVVEADLHHCYSIAADLDQTLEWSRKNGMKEVNILERDEQGMGRKVEFVAKAPIGLDMKNVLLYNFEAPRKISFRSLSGNVITTLDGCYTFAPFSGRGGGTVVTYELAAQFPFKVPGFIQEQITGIIATTAVMELRNHILKKRTS